MDIVNGHWKRTIGFVNGHCDMNNRQWIIENIQCTIYNVLCTMFNGHWTI